MKRLLLLVLAFAIAAPSGAFAMSSPRNAQPVQVYDEWGDDGGFWDDDTGWESADDGWGDSGVFWDDDDGWGDDGWGNDWDQPQEIIITFEPEPEPVVIVPEPTPAPEPEPAQTILLAFVSPQHQQITSIEARGNIPPEWERFYRELADYCLRFPIECINDPEYALVPEIFRWEALQRFVHSPRGQSVAISPHIIHTHTHHEHLVPVAQQPMAHAMMPAPVQTPMAPVAPHHQHTGITSMPMHEEIDPCQISHAEWTDNNLRAVLERLARECPNPWDNFEPFKFRLSMVDFDGPYLSEMIPYTGDLATPEEGVIRFQRQIPQEGFTTVRPVPRQTTPAVNHNLVTGGRQPQYGTVIVHRRALVKPIVNVGVYSR